MNYPTSATEDTRWNFWIYAGGQFAELDMDWLNGKRPEMLAKICWHAKIMRASDGYELYAISWPILTDEDFAIAKMYKSASENELSRYEEKTTEEAMHFYMFENVWGCNYLVFHDLGYMANECNVVFIEKYGDLLAFAQLTKIPITYEG